MRDLINNDKPFNPILCDFLVVLNKFSCLFYEFKL